MSRSFSMRSVGGMRSDTCTEGVRTKALRYSFTKAFILGDHGVADIPVKFVSNDH